MSNRPSLAWMEKYRDTVNADPEMSVIGDWFTADFKISFEGAEFLISVREGKIADIEENPRFDRPAAFSLRAASLLLSGGASHDRGAARGQRVGVDAAEVEKWSCEQVGKWLRHNGLHHLAATFLEQRVDGYVLLRVTDNELSSVLNCRAFGDRKRILEFVASVQPKQTAPGTFRLQRTLPKQRRVRRPLVQISEFSFRTKNPWRLKVRTHPRRTLLNTMQHSLRKKLKPCVARRLPQEQPRWKFRRPNIC